ncbi:hypothetical protein PTI98_009976 [Pleurotus ostreatus]|uniref:Uncharacterized protein n=1 Tax=Pleurotus cornucopiae TaxID=5321 RepID=A0ACB7J2N6_PLECO|nr:hypothetical protein CCMSSC00406_0002017 [Pleurotus cornucopiae]KAJ8692683.1 hypothetical protein PTI98_009976 [Pleurotus ostreatus]
MLMLHLPWQRNGVAQLLSRPSSLTNVLRSFSTTRITTNTTASQPGVEEPSKPKPKATTPLRRSASASLAIRSNPTPTRGDIQPVFTLATAERFLFSRLCTSPALPSSARILKESLYIPSWPTTHQNSGPDNRGTFTSKLSPSASKGEIFIFSNGSFVCWGLGEAEARRFASEVIEKSTGAQIAPLRDHETEELEFVTDPSEDTRLQGDLIILGRTPPSNTEIEDSSSSAGLDTNSASLAPSTLLARYAFSQALSRSTALSALEVSLDDYLSSMALLPLSLEQTGKPGMGRKALIKKLGQLMKFRQGINLNRENYLETPDFYWAEPVLEGYFNSMSDALEIKARTTSVNDKITYATEAQSVLRQLLTESSSHRMELIIIALIAVEVVVALIRDGPELWEMTFGHKNPEESTRTSDALLE